MKYRKATESDALSIYNLVQNTIRTVYPLYYPQGVVDFFSTHHSIDNVIRDVKNGDSYILIDDGVIAGTGTHIDEHITRVFVSPKFQGLGCGTYIMQKLEDEISSERGYAYVDASLAACMFYEHRGYRTVGHESVKTEKSVLVYEIMKKDFSL